MPRGKRTHKVPTNSLRVIVDPRRELGLTERQEKFAKIYATEDVTQTEAARLAGFKNPGNAASHFMSGKRFPLVLKRVQEIKEELAQKYEVTFENHVMRMAQIRDLALDGKNFTAAVAAEKARGQAAGLYITRSEILVGKIDQMSRDEVLSEIRRLQAEFPVLANTTMPTIDMEAADPNDYEENDDDLDDLTEGSDMDLDDED